MFQTYETSGLYFYLFGEKIPKNSIRKKSLLGITKAPDAGS